MSNSYLTSSGERVKKSVIDSRTSKAKAKKKQLMIEEYGYLFCEECERSDKAPYDPAHVISVDKCQKMGKSELAWDLSNITILCRGCHQKRDGLNLQFK